MPFCNWDFMIILALQVAKVRLDTIYTWELSRFYGYYITFLRVAPRWLFQSSTVWLKYGRSLCRRWFMYVFIYTIGLNSHYWIYWTVRTVLTHKILWQFVGLRGAEVLQQTEQRQWWAAFNPSDVSLRAVALVTWSAHFAPWLTILMWPAGFPKLTFGKDTLKAIKWMWNTHKLWIYIWIIYSSVDDVSYFKGLQGPMMVLKFQLFRSITLKRLQKNTTV